MSPSASCIIYKYCTPHQIQYGYSWRKLSFFSTQKTLSSCLKICTSSKACTTQREYESLTMVTMCSGIPRCLCLMIYHRLADSVCTIWACRAGTRAQYIYIQALFYPPMHQLLYNRSAKYINFSNVLQHEEKANIYSIARHYRLIHKACNNVKCNEGNMNLIA